MNYQRVIPEAGMTKSVWERRYEEHACWSRLEHAREVLGELDIDDAEGESAQHVARAQRVLRLIGELRGEADPLWVDVEALQGLESGANALVQAADQYSSSGNEGHLPQLSAASDQLVRVAHRLQTPAPMAATQALSREVEEARQAGRALETQVNESMQVLESRREEAHSGLSEAANALESRLSDLRTNLDATQNEIKALTTQDREARTQQFKSHLEEQKGEFQEQLATLEGEFMERMNAARASADEALEEVERRREEVENEAGAVAVSALGGRLEETADREDRRAFWWTIAAIGIALLVVPALAWTSSVMAGTDGTLERAAVAIALVSASGYAARAAGRHRKQAEHYRERENRMKTLLPFTANLDPGEATALKVLAGLDVFVPEELEEGTADGPAPRHYLEGLLRDRVQKRLQGKTGANQQ